MAVLARHLLVLSGPAAAPAEEGSAERWTRAEEWSRRLVAEFVVEGVRRASEQLDEGYALEARSLESVHVASGDVLVLRELTGVLAGGERGLLDVLADAFPDNLVVLLPAAAALETTPAEELRSLLEELAVAAERKIS